MNLQEERLHKFLARAGIASRRAAETMILDGRVKVNGQVVTVLGTKVNPSTDKVEVDGHLITIPQAGHMTYILLNKPTGYLTTMSDPQGRPTVKDLLAGVRERVYPVGRLDYDTEGVLLLTNDGELAHALTHPRFGVSKTYLVEVAGIPSARAIRMLQQGVVLDGRRTSPARVKIRGVNPAGNAWLEIVIHEGRKRQVRRMCEVIGHPVLRLQRTKVAFLNLKGVPKGKWRYLTKEEVCRLRRLAGLTQEPPSES